MGRREGRPERGKMLPCRGALSRAFSSGAGQGCTAAVAVRHDTNANGLLNIYEDRSQEKHSPHPSEVRYFEGIHATLSGTARFVRIDLRTSGHPFVAGASRARSQRDLVRALILRALPLGHGDTSMGAGVPERVRGPTHEIRRTCGAGGPIRDRALTTASVDTELIRRPGPGTAHRRSADRRATNRLSLCGKASRAAARRRPGSSAHSPGHRRTPFRSS
jgi:hypothetical protein